AARACLCLKNANLASTMNRGMGDWLAHPLWFLIACRSGEGFIDSPSAAEKTREALRSRLEVFGFTAVEGVVADSVINLGNGQVARCQLFRVGRLVQAIRIGTK
ncbi:hypothetical protein, partial [Archangium sp.]|uniref:hypothetical protein n=1 Tax=Archangium sp. TaxID=1872627 RepID=UPI002D33AB84